MATPSLNPSPKSIFLKNSGFITDHRALIESDAYQRAETFALLQLMRMLAAKASADPSIAAANHFALVGVHQYLDVLRNLSETQVVIARRDPDNLPEN